MQQKGIHWFPGHMVKALREIQERVKIVDIVVEVVDSRCPLSSKNPFLEDIIKNKKRLIVFTKKDLCDSEKLPAFSKFYQEKGYECVCADLNNPGDVKVIVSSIMDLGKEKQQKYIAKGMKVQPLRVMIIGIPNVGKSTLINRLVKRNAASSRNTPGHTRAQQWVRVNENFELLDTPGILPPHYEDKSIATNLALIGSIKEDILPLDEVYSCLVNLLINNYKPAFEKRYDASFDSMNEEEITAAIGKNRGLLVKGGEVDYDAVKKLVLKEFRNGLITKVMVDSLC